MTTWIHAFLDIPSEQWEVSRAFWAAATGWSESPTRGEHQQFVTLVPPEGDAWLKLQRVEADGGMHVDLDSPDRRAAVGRARAAGASPAWTYGGVEVMRSPGGFVLCHTVGGPGRAVRTGSSILDQVCLDIPPADWDSETAFWAEVTGRRLEQGSMPGFARLVDPAGGLRLLLQRRDEGEGPVTAHPDLAVADRPGETVRHRGLGAEVVDVREWWTVLRAPEGRLYCLTDRDPATGRVRPRRGGATAEPCTR